MRAVILKGHGGPEMLQPANVPDAVAGIRQVLVRVHACGVCGFDCRSREGLPGYQTPPGVILGHEIAGEVVALGPEAVEFRVGDRVASLQQGSCGVCELCSAGRHSICPHYHETTYGSTGRPGGYAELVAADESTLVKIPAGVSWKSAAIAGCGIGVALHALNRGRARLGEHVMVTGAGGGLGVHALQLARLAGCQVTAVTSPESKMEMLGRYADKVVLFRDGKYQSTDLRPDLVIENTAGITLPATLRAVKRGGRVVIAGMVGTKPVPFMPGPFFAREIELIGSNATSRAELKTVLDLLASNRIDAVVTRELPLEQASLAHQLIDEQAVFGRVVLTPTAAPAPQE